MQYVSMGEVTLSRIVRGFWRLTGPKAGSWNISDEALKEMIAGCLDRGIILTTGCFCLIDCLWVFSLLKCS